MLEELVQHILANIEDTTNCMKVTKILAEDALIYPLRPVALTMLANPGGQLTPQQLLDLDAAKDEYKKKYAKAYEWDKKHKSNKKQAYTLIH